MKIREAASSESQYVVDIYGREGLEDEVELVGKGIGQKFAGIDQGLRKIWFAEEDGLVVGTIQLVFTDEEKPELADGKNTFMIHHLRVSKDYENRGIASTLYQTLETEARQLRAKTITLEVEKTNPRARSIYEHWGYTYWKDGADENEVVLRKEL